MYYLLQYDFVESVVERRAPYREAHLKFAREALARGELVMGGALADPVDSAVIVFEASAPSVVEEFAKQDPYVTSGVVTRWRIRPWTVVIGGRGGG